MADPFTWGAVGMGASVLGGGLDAFGKMSKGDSDSRMYGYKAGMAMQNAKIATQNAEYTRTQGEKSALYSGISGAQKSGAIVAHQAANGLEVNSGTNVKVQEGQAWANREDQKNIQDTATRKAYAYDVESSNKTQEAAMDRTAGSNAKSAGFIGAIGSILGTASSVASKWSQGNSTGLWGNDSKTANNDDDFTLAGWKTS